MHFIQCHLNSSTPIHVTLPLSLLKFDCPFYDLVIYFKLIDHYLFQPISPSKFEIILEIFSKLSNTHLSLSFNFRTSAIILVQYLFMFHV